MNSNTPKILPLLVAAVLLVPGCKQAKQEDAVADDPKVSGQSVIYSADAPELKRLPTVAVEAPHASELVLPARIVWDEDHTSHVMPPVSGHLLEVTKAGVLGAAVKQDEVLAYLASAEVGAAQVDAATAKAALGLAEKNYQRVNELLVDKGASAKDLEQARADLEHAQAEAVRTDLRLKVLGITAAAVDQQLAVRSPISGIIVERNTNPGMEWRADQAAGPLFTVTDPTYLWCLIDVPEAQIDKLQVGAVVKIHTNALPQESYDAVIDNIADAVDLSSRTVKVRARLRNEKRHLKNEMYVLATLVAQPAGNFDVPAKAVFLNKSDQQVFVKTGATTYTRKTIEVVATSDQWVSVAGGLAAGEQVVVDGSLYLEKIIEGAATTQAASGKP